MDTIEAHLARLEGAHDQSGARLGGVEQRLSQLDERVEARFTRLDDKMDRQFYRHPGSLVVSILLPVALRYLPAP